MGGRNFSLTEHISDFVDREVASGRHQNASEVVREALRRYEDDIRAENAALVMIETIAEQGIASIEKGDFTLISGAEGSKALLDRLNSRFSRRGDPNDPSHG